MRTTFGSTARRAWSRWRGCRCSLRSRGKRAVVAGGSPRRRLEGGAAVGGRRRRRRLRARVPAKRCGPRGRPAAAAPSRCMRAPWEAADFAGAAIAVGAFDDETRPRASPPPRARAGVPVNVIDKPAFCDFSFGSIVNRSPLVIGISTDGAAPVFAQAIRAKLEAMIPRGFARWARGRAALARRRASRPACRSPAAGSSGRPSPRTPSAHPDHEPVQADFDALLADTCASRRRRSSTAPSRWSAPAPAIPSC